MADPEVQQPIVRGPFDNDISMLYRWAIAYGIPIKYMVVIPSRDVEGPTVNTFRPISLIINEMLEEDPDIPYINIYRTIDAILPLLSPEDLGFLIYENEIDRAEKNLRQQKIESEEPFDEQDLIEELEDRKLHLNFISKINDMYRDIQLLRDPDMDLDRFKSPYPEENLFKPLYYSWVNDLETSLAHDNQILDGILAQQQVLSEEIPARSGPLIVNQVTVRLQPVIYALDTDGNKVGEPRKVKPSDGIDIFDDSLLNRPIPYVQYNSTLDEFTEEVRKKYYKIFQGDSPQTKINLNYILPPFEKTQDPDTIYMSILTGVDENAKLTKNSYQTHQYDLAENRLVVSSPVNEAQNETLILNRVANTFPSLDLGTPKEISIGGVFYIYDEEITPYSLNDMIMNDPELSQYLYVDEVNKSHANKVQHKIRFKSLLDSYEGGGERASGSQRNFSAADINLKQFYVSDKTKAYFIEDGERISLPMGTPFLEVRIMNAENRETAQNFIEIFRRLLTYYAKRRDELDAYYQTMIPLLSQPLPQMAAEEAAVGAATPGKSRTKITGTPRAARPPTPHMRDGEASCLVEEEPAKAKGPGAPPVKTRIKRKNLLEQYAPDVFVSGYARACQCKFQPEPIPEDQIEAWESKEFIHGGTLYNQQVLHYPAHDPKYHFVCTNPDYPFPGVVEPKAKKLSNSDKYPYLPCCYKINHMDPNSKTAYAQHYYNVKKEESTQTKSNVIHGDKMLPPHRIGVIPATKLAELIENYSEDAIKIYRYGTARTVNSLIHCVLTALDAEEYMELKTDEEREEVALAVRDRLASEEFMHLYKQELYDYSTEQIRGQLEDETLFFDPRLYYRGLEEMFNINIYTFVPITGNKEDTTNGRMEIPRCKLFHTRPARTDRRCVVVYKHRGSATDTSQHPHCELIVDYDEREKNIIKLFGDNMSDFLHGILLSTNQVLSTNILEEDPATVSMRANLYRLVDFYAALKRKAKAQIIDEYGKVIAFIFESAEGPAAIFMPSTQPEKLPVHDGPLPRISLETATLMCCSEGDERSQAHSATVNRDGLMDGVWFPALGLDDAIYIPLKPRLKPDDLPEGPRCPVVEKHDNVVTRLQKMRKTLDLMLQIIRWIFVLAQVDAPVIGGKRAPVLAQEFADRYFVVVGSPLTTDSAQQYDLSACPRVLPDDMSVDEALVYMEQFVPDLIQNGKIRFYSPILQDKVTQKLQEFYILASPLPIEPADPNIIGEDWEIPTEIKGLYETSSDFKQIPLTHVFISQNDVEKWIDATKSPSYENIPVHTNLKEWGDYGRYTEPYIYEHTDGKIYLIQNVNQYSFERALRVVIDWHNLKINSGAEAEPWTDPAPVPHVIYSIAPDGSVYLSEDNSLGEPVYLHLLLYGVATKMIKDQETGKFENVASDDTNARKFAAMLPLR